MVSYAQSALYVLLPLLSRTGAGAQQIKSWDVLDVKLPQALSDNSATFLPRTSSPSSKLSGDRIVIAGGCNSPKGNTYVDATGAELDFFICESTSAGTYAFNPLDGTFETLADMPRARYRHAAVHIGGRIWLVGGRTIPDDAVIAEIDVYDPVSDTWSTPGSIPEEYLTSDNAAFTDRDGTLLYVTGGYNPGYDNPTALATTFAINVNEALNNNNIVITEKAPLNTQRGDVHAVSSADDMHVYVTGGFSMYPCVPLETVERYDIAHDAWTFVDSLSSARGDKALVELNGKIFAVGGETTPRDTCADNPNDVPPLSAQSVAVDDVEMYDPTTAGGEGAVWTTVDDIPNFRFRFSGAAWDDTDTIYTFGGQNGYDDDCKCFPTSDAVVAYQLGGDGTSSGSTKKCGAFGLVLATIAGAAFGSIAFV